MSDVGGSGGGGVLDFTPTWPRGGRNYVNRERFAGNCLNVNLDNVASLTGKGQG